MRLRRMSLKAPSFDPLTKYFESKFLRKRQPNGTQSAAVERTQRQRTPSPPETQTRSQSLSILPLEEPLNFSWPRSNQNSDDSQRPRSSSHPGRKDFRRPSTATLRQPKVLDEKLKDEIDMSVMSRQMMNKLVIKMDHKGSSDYSSDFTSSSSSLSSRSPCEEIPSYYDSESESKKRPSTMRLNRQTSRITVPVINNTCVGLPRRGKTATIRSHIPLRKRMMLADDILGPKQKLLVPEPCNTCGKDQNPERFHTHPESAAKFKAKLKLSKDKKLKENNKSASKLAVSKPTALRYKSRLLQENFESSNVRNDKKEPYPKPNMKFMQENNPKKQRRKPSLVTHPMKNNNSSSHKENLSNSSEALIQIPEKAEDDIQIDIESEPAHNTEQTNSEPKSNKLTKDSYQNDVKEQINSKESVTIDSTAVKPKSKSAEIVDKRPIRVCYICGRQFGSRSLQIHEPQCLEKWERENENLAEHLKRPKPTKPDKDLTREEWNEHAYKMAQQQLVPCENCGRTFFPERLEVHQRGCKPPSGRRQSQAATAEYKSVRKVSARPSIKCYICGRDFGTRSINIHEPQCIQKWNYENDKLPDHLRQDEPKKPEILYNEKGEIDKAAMSEAAWKSHLDTLVKCSGCSRTFYPDRLEIHQKSCIKVD